MNERAPDRPRARRFTLGGLALGLTWLACAAAAAQDRENCLYCHRFPGLSRFDPDSGRLRLFYVDPAYIHEAQGPHAQLACTDCHAREPLEVVPHRPSPPVDCTRTCHITDLSGNSRRFSHENVARMREQSAHTDAVLHALEFTGVQVADQSQSRCLYCHDEPLFRMPLALESPIGALQDRAFARCNVCHATQLPLDVEFATRHVLSRLDPARRTLELAQVCAVCHSDPAIREKHELPNSVASYLRSFHGRAALLGDEATADCLSCHVANGANVHLMLASADSDSAIHPDNVANSCRSLTCHPGADRAIAGTAVHLDLPSSVGSIEFLLAVAFILLTALSFGPSAAIVLLELAQLVIGRRHPRAEHVEHVLEQVLRHPEGKQRLRRFTLPERAQHWVLAALFTLLALTGFPLKFADQGWARVLVDAFGGMHMTRTLHHYAGVALIVGFAIHVLDIFRVLLKRTRRVGPRGERLGLYQAVASLPVSITLTDMRQAGALLKYLVGMSKDRPRFGRFTVTEKFEYFGVMWGTTLLGITGLMLWFEQATSHLMGGWAFNIATIIHTYESFLALIHVGILHIYNVILAPTVFPLSLATLSGETPNSKLAEENAEFVIDVAHSLGIPTEEPQHG